MASLIRNTRAFAVGLLVLCGCRMAPMAYGQPANSLLIVHGIQGQDLDPSCIPTLPVEIGAPNGILAPVANFGDIVGPLLTGPSTRLLVSSSACPALPIKVETKVNFKAGAQLAAVFAEGTNGAPTMEVYDITEATPVVSGTARVVMVHAANAPAIDVTLTEDGTGTVVKLSDLMPGTRVAGDILPFTGYSVRVFQAGTTNQLSGPIGVTAANRAIDALFLVGNAANGTITVITKQIHGIL